MREEEPAMAGQAQYSNADVLLVTATKVEATAVLHLFEKPQLRRIGDKTYYDLGVVNGANVFLVQTEMGTEGPGGATLTVRQAIYDLSPSAVIMVGIAFGVNRHEQRIGDILVSKQLLVYESQRIGTGSDGRATITMRGDRPLASLRLLQLATTKPSKSGRPEVNRRSTISMRPMRGSHLLGRISEHELV